MSEDHEGNALDTARAETTNGPRMELGFEIRFETADEEQMAIPCADLEEVERILVRLREACARGGVDLPALELWRLERGAPRALSGAELEEAGSAVLRSAVGR